MLKSVHVTPPTINPTLKDENAQMISDMEITKFVVSGRDQALLYGDYGTYRAQLSRRLHSVRKRLGRTTKKGAKHTNKAAITAEDIASNNE